MRGNRSYCYGESYIDAPRFLVSMLRPGLLGRAVQTLQYGGHVSIALQQEHLA